MPETFKNTKVKGRTTFRIAAVLFLLSAAFELVGIFSAVPLLGVFRGGFSAAVYHLLFAAIYLALGIGLWTASSWCYKLIFAATLLVTLDKLQYIIYRETILVEMMRRAGTYRQLLQAIDRQMFLQILMLVAALFAAGWWGFAAYTYFRRDYFRSSNPDERRPAMPTYEFVCEDCSKSFSVMLSLAEYETKKYECPTCGSKRVKQQITSFQTVTSKKS